MRLTQPSDENFIEIMSWFSTEEELSIWSGPNFRYPFDLSSFKSDLKLDSLKSFSLVSVEGNLLAFGQYYLRLDKCHLGRLIVNPNFRGQGIASHLIQKLGVLGKTELKTDSCSLFVLGHNKSAIQAYTKLGFSMADYPDEIPLEDCLYMVKV
ncbi:GNAT family N-acetyltransferase [Shewanella baltica]|uniref:GNAT family N-acetyltransferase n=1 Tax=Shewanella baltica TaxID=62322 RepID=UPI0007B4E5C5|nr:GNAT family N-acetyltransferase [Shewanella baltica]KZK66257.1 acetyltransferase [Shewanella baltica]